MPDAVKNLMVGDILQLQFAPPSEIAERYAVKLVGYLPGQSLIITTPRKQGVTLLVREGHAFTVRLLQGSNVFGFVASVLAVALKPFPHLYLTYPHEVESAVIRNAPRVPTLLNALVYNTRAPEAEKDVQPVIIIDLSATGARLLLPSRLGKIGEMMQLQLSLQVCGDEDQLQILGTIRSVRESLGADGKTDYIHGLQFEGVTRFQRLLLCSYVLEQITNERG